MPQHSLLGRLPECLFHRCSGTFPGLPASIVQGLEEKQEVKLAETESYMDQLGSHINWGAVCFLAVSCLLVPGTHPVQKSGPPPPPLKVFTSTGSGAKRFLRLRSQPEGSSSPKARKSLRGRRPGDGGRLREGAESGRRAMARREGAVGESRLYNAAG